MQVFFDVGARWGEAYVNYMRTNPNILGVLFEPHPEYYSLLLINFLYKPYVKILPYAVTDKEGVATFNIAAGEGTSSLLKFSPNLAETWKGRTGFDIVQSIEVKVVRLESIVELFNTSRIEFFARRCPGS